MAISQLIRRTGRWRGKYQLIVEPDQPVRESESTAVVAPVAGGRFVRIDYLAVEADYRRAD